MRLTAKHNGQKVEIVGFCPASYARPGGTEDAEGEAILTPFAIFIQDGRLEYDTLWAFDEVKFKRRVL